MKVCCLADAHGHLPPPNEMPDADLLLLAGDMAPWEDHSLANHRRWWREVFAPWCRALGVGADRIGLIAGNHDLLLWAGPPPREVAAAVTYLQDSAARVHGGQLVYGCPWSRYLPGWVFGLPEADADPRRPSLESAHSRIASDADIILVHGPPYGIGDIVLGGERVGSPSLLKRIDEVQPKLVVCGHIHESYGVYRRGETVIVNASRMTVDYEPTNPPILVEISG